MIDDGGCGSEPAAKTKVVRWSIDGNFLFILGYDGEFCCKGRVLVARDRE